MATERVPRPFGAAGAMSSMRAALLDIPDFFGRSRPFTMRAMADMRACAGVMSGFSRASLPTIRFRTLASSLVSVSTSGFSTLASGRLAPGTPASAARSAASVAFTSPTIVVSLVRSDISFAIASSLPSFKPSSERSKMPPLDRSMSSPARSSPRWRMLAILFSNEVIARCASFSFMPRPRTIMPSARFMSVRVMPEASSGWVSSRNLAVS